jgi:acetoin:2,6-dichlorophenolindophenol oxidoreductase subunit alpha
MTIPLPAPSSARGLEPAALRACRRTMVRIRAFEERVQQLFLQGEIPGTTHLYIGQEAVATGVETALRPDDYVAATYRGHGHALARGVDTEALAAEMLGRATGVCGGRAGSMNVIDLDRGLLGSFGIIGGTVAAATGVGLSIKGSGRVVVPYFGDGTTNHGYFHECLNFAKVFDLPVVFVCENNGYGEFTPWLQVTAGGDLGARARVFDIPAERVDGMDVREVAAAAGAAVARARAGEGPQFVEAVTYRFAGHSRSDPGAYRPPGELERWKQRDPLLLSRTALIEEGLPAGDVDADEQTVRDQVAAAFEAALAAPFPEPSSTATGYAHAS